jgi:putative ABC transport system substrate-binding protein
MRRREFIGLLVAAAAVTWPGFARAQSLAGGVKRPVIGILSIRTSEHDSAIKTFLDALATLGYVDGKSAIIVARYAAGEQGALPKLADELARLNPDVIMADAPSPIKAAMSAAPNIPIVGATMGSPVRQGLIASFSRPGGNVTGIASQVEDVTAKLLGFGMEMVPDAKHMGLLIDPRADNAAVMRRDFQTAAESAASASIPPRRTCRTSLMVRSTNSPMPASHLSASRRPVCSTSISATSGKRRASCGWRQSPTAQKRPTPESC